MKNLILIASLLFGITAMADTPEFMGGIVKNKKQEMGMVCALYDNDNNCEEIEVMARNTYNLEFVRVAVLRKVDSKTLSSQARRNAAGDLYEDYQQVSLYGTVIGVGAVWIFEGAILAYPVFALGVVADVVKAPFVLGAFLLHKITDIGAKRRFKNLIKHMMNPKSVGKTKKTRKRYFNNLYTTFNNN